MYILDKVKQDLAKQINKLLNTSVVSAVDFVTPPQPALGDFSLPIFVLAKKLNKNPLELAKEIAGKIKGAVAAGPYVNFKLEQKVIAEIIAQINYEQARYGLNKTGNQKRVMIEYSNANTHKEYHVGHLRNIAYGDAVTKILAANGWTALPVSYINDFGIHVAKTIWWLYHEQNDEAKKMVVNGLDSKGYFLGRQYAKSVKEIEERSEAKGEVASVMKQIESRRGEIYRLWKKTRGWSLKHLAQIYKELGVKFKVTFYENEFLNTGLKFVKELEKRGILRKSEGAVIADLEKYNLGVLVVLRSDGTALYPVADLPLAAYKIKYYKLDTSLYVVDVRQDLYFRQLFKLLELLGFKTKFQHLPYEFVKLPSGMMSSRTGNIIAYDDLKNLALKKAKAEIIARHATWPVKQINAVARSIAFGALKFEMIKVSANKQITFNIDEALRFDGFTAAYLQYTYARLQSIVRKAPIVVKNTKPLFEKLIESKEKTLALRLGEFPQAVQAAGDSQDPAAIAKYLFALAQLTNDYYHAIPVLKAEAAIAKTRLELLKTVALVIKKGLGLLGIETVEEM